MNISDIRIERHIKLKFETHTTHVFTFAQPVDLSTITKHPAISVFLEKQALSNYMLLESSCQKTVRLKIANNPKDVRLED